jgi:hypothetical protein
MNPDAVVQAQSGTPLQVLQSDSNHVVLELQVSNYDTNEQTVDGTAFSVVTVPDFGSTGEPGKPALPIKGAMIGIPAGAQVALRVLDDQSQQSTLARPPLPTPTQRVKIDPSRPESPRTTTSYARDAATYSANRLYPTDAAEITSTGNWRSQRYAVVEFHPLQYNPVSRQLVFHRRLRVEVTFTYPGGLRAGSLGGPANEGAFESVLQNSLLNYDTAKNWRTSAPAPRAPQSGTAYSGGTWYKVGVVSDGIYKLACNQLTGNPSPNIDPATLRLYKENTEMAINVVGGWQTSCTASDYIEFFGQSPESFYSQSPYNQPVRAKYAPENIYWLNFGVAGSSKRIATRDGSVSGAMQTTFIDTIHLEQNQRYLTQIPRVEDKDHWVWDYVSQGYGNPSRSYTFSLSRLAGGAGFATLQIDLFGVNAGYHHTITSINSHLVDDTTWGPGLAERQVTLTFDKGWLLNGTNTITINEPDIGPVGTDPDLIYTNFFDVSYQATFIAESDMLRFRQTSSAAARYSISNFGSSPVNVFNITDRFNVATFYNTLVTGTGPYTLGFGDNPGAPAEYIALTPGQDKSPNSITLDTASNLHSTSNSADYIFIAYRDFVAGTQVLSNYRNAPNLLTKVVDVQDIYDEFSDGLVDAHAIRAFLEYAYANWNQPRPSKAPPSYVLLVGDGTFDPRGYCSSGTCPNLSTPLNATFIPPYLRMVDPWMGEVPSDNRFVSFNDGTNNTLPNMMIGRLPANNAAEVDTMVNRTKAYEQNPPTVDWGSKMTFVADTAYDSSGTPDPAGDFWTGSDAIATNPAYVFPVFAVNRAFYNACPTYTCTLYTPYTNVPTENSHIVNAINGGSLFLSYMGHGSNELWSNDSIFTTGDVSSLSNAGKLTIPLEMTCLTGNFADPRPALNSLAETMLRAKSGSQAIGAVADWAATGLGVQEGHDLLEKGFFNGVMYQAKRQMGAAAVMGKTYLWINGVNSHRDLIDTYTLLGDPALHLTLPTWPNLYLPFIKR